MDPQIRVLVVDDDEPHAQAVAESLERVGYDCAIATSGREALRAIEEQEFDIVLPNTGKYAEVSRDFVVRPLEVGRRITLNPPPFDLRKDDLKAGTEDDMRELARTLTLNPNVSVEVLCYPDEELAPTQAAAISVARGNALKEYLENAGVNSSRINVKVANSTDPINPPPIKKGAKGKRYVGSAYLVITKV